MQPFQKHLDPHRGELPPALALDFPQGLFM